ncbi:vacuolar protein sorting-associated protein [Purpureocillium lavendulum]|uniref:Vacuolar protein sorting-associated protein n=1 Tax=Purpureocillium lavendulum TaxID=1247861 RepID=A0AB34FPJ8_9HYPO|nr:vacuolar protein sorting-associated protein [Purpureocillium lavendulum]
MYWVRRGTILVSLFLIISFVAWFVPRALDPTRVSPERRARDRLWVNSSPYFWDRQLCRWISVCGLNHLRRDPASLFSPKPPVDDDDGDDGDDGGGAGDLVFGELRRRALAADVPPRSWEDEPLDPSEASDGGFVRQRPDTKRLPTGKRKILKDIPSYVLKYAPLVHLYSGEQFWPSDIREHIQHMNVTVNGELLDSNNTWTLNNLSRLNENRGFVVLHSLDDVETRPDWLHSHVNRPGPYPDSPDGGDEHPVLDDEDQPVYRKERTSWFDVDKQHPLHRIADPRPETRRLGARSERPRILPRGHKPDADGYSKAPAVLVLVDKGSGVVDAFWFFFYSYNLGQTVLGIRFGNHIGDWEHCMIRFENGEPRGIFFSEHEGGQAYAWDAIEKRGVRPVIYSAVGSHAMYPLPGEHPYVLPFRMLKDVTDKGPLWDPALNNYAYHYDYTKENRWDTRDPWDDKVSRVGKAESLVPAASNPDAPTSWFHYRGRWGDEVYTLADIRQWRLFGQYHYVTGPSGPKFKHLDRSKLCQSRRCRILYKIDPKRTWY